MYFETQHWTALFKMSIRSWNKQQTLLEALGESEILVEWQCVQYASLHCPPLCFSSLGSWWHQGAPAWSEERHPLWQMQGHTAWGKQFVCSCIYWLQLSCLRWWLLFCWTAFISKLWIDWEQHSHAPLEISEEGEPKPLKLWASGEKAEIWTSYLLGRQSFACILSPSN